MSAQNQNAKRNTIKDITSLKGNRPIVSLTSYSANIARIADKYCDFILVGDSLGMVLYGMDSTVPVSVEMMINHGTCVVNSTEKALIVIDMPFGSYQQSPEQAFSNACLIMKQTGAAAIKLEGGIEMAKTCAFLSERGIPVLGHIGLKPQSVHAEGGYKVTGRYEDEKIKILEDAKSLDQSGVFGIVLECMDPDFADELTRCVSVPTIGIGASSECDGQILVTEDMLGLSTGKPPKFVKRYADLLPQAEQAIKSYAQEVTERSFPSEEHTYARKSVNKKVKILKS